MDPDRADVPVEDQTTENEPLVLSCMNCSFTQLRSVIQEINFASRTTAAAAIATQPRQQLFLPLELSGYVATFFTVPRVVPSQVEAVAASSLDATHKLTGCLVNDEDSWWLSGFGTMPGGRGDEYVEFRLCPRPLLRRVVAVFVRIPPLPLGPLSVREFRVEVSDENLTWRNLPEVYSVDNRTGLQRFPIGNIDAYCIRIVCLSNQISQFLEAMESPHRMERVGFYAVQFE